MPHLLFLVEDDKIIGENVQDFFTEFGYFVTWEERGDIAQKMLKVHTFDLIILDFSLPQVTGLELIQFIRGNQDNTPIIMVTANSDEDEKQQCRKAGANALFGKPFEFDELLKCVETLLLPVER